MSLFRKLVLSTSILMFLMLSATFVVVMHAERQLLAHQLREDASIAALNLATRLRGALAPDERDQREQWVDELFHGGEYRRVVFHDLADNTAIYRTHTLEGLDTPEWFVNTFALADGFGAASVKVVGAVQGRVFVSKHPARAYATLWWHFLLNMWLFLGVALMVYALILVFAAWHFRGLRRLQGQAKNVLRGNYGQVMDITCASDVNTLAVTINWLTAKLRNILSEQLMISQSLHTEAHLDPLTGLPNRNAFEAQMHAWVSADGGGPGVLLLLHVAGVYELNDSHGRDAGDSLLRRVAELMRDSLATWPGGFASRRTGCDFAVFVPGMAQEEAAHWLSGIKVRVESIELAVNSEMVNFWLGAAASRAITSMAKMLSAADAALRLARSSGRTDWAVYPVDDPLIDVRPAGEWQQFLKRMIERKEVLLHFQPMYSRALEPMGSEVFCRANDEGEIVPAGVFWPLAERFGLVPALDQLVLEGAIQSLANNSERVLSVNVSSLSVIDPLFIRWLTGYLSLNSEVCDRLILEFHERVLTLAEVDFELVHGVLSDLGVKIALDHCGITPETLGQLQLLELAYIKIDRRFIAGIATDQCNRFYMQTLVQLAHACDVKILADGVESDSEWEALLRLHVNGGQGFFFGRPSAQMPASGVTVALSKNN